MSDPWAAFNPQPAPATAPSGAQIVGVPRPKEPSIPSGYEPDGPGALKAIPGGPADKKASGDALSPEALDAETTNWILTGKMSPLGMGNGPLRVQIENNRPVIMRKYGIGDNNLPAVQKQFDADAKAYSSRTQQISLMNQANDAAKQHVEQISKYLDELPAQTNLTPLNYLSLEAQRAGSGRTVTDLDATIPLLQGEVAKIMTANPASGAGQLTDDARREFDILNSSRSPAARKEAMQALMEMVNRKITGTQAEADRLSQRINGGLSSYAVGAPPSAGSPPPINPIAGGGDGDPGPSLAPSGGETRSVVNPKIQALGAKIVTLMSKGADRNTIMGFAVRAEPQLRNDPKFGGWLNDALKYRKDHPGAKYPIDPSFYTTEVPLSSVEQGRNEVAQSSAGALAMNAGDAVTAGNMGKITGDQERVDRALAVANQQHPGASLAGSVIGGATAAAGGEAALARLGMAPGLLRAILADSTYGGVTGGTHAQPGNMLGGIAKGAAIAAAGSAGGNAVARGVSSVARGVTNPTVGYVAREVPDALTIGQAVSQSGTVGRAVKGIEDRLSGLPIVGGVINDRRIEGLQKMNSKAFDRALEPIGGNVSGKFGEEAVQAAQDKVGEAFSKALAGKSAGLDRRFIVEATKAKNTIDALPDSVRGEVNNQVDHVVNNYFDDGGQISGENMQPLLQELGGIKRSYQGTPLGHRIGQAVDQMTDSVENLFRRQAPDVMPQYDAAKKAFKRVSTLENAVLRAKNESKDGNAIFTTGQLGMADRANTVKFGGTHAAAAGKGEFHDFQRNMQEVLPNKVPDSGTAGRLILPAAVLGLSGGAGYESGNTKTGLTLGGLLALAYTKTGQRMLTAAVLKRGNAAKTVGRALQRAAPLAGHAGAASASRDLSGD